MNTLSWRTPTTPLPMEINPRKVFERMFGEGGSAAERVARIREDRSILDAIAREAAGLQLQLGPSDRQTMSQYLENVREIERRIQRAEKSQGDADLQLPTRPAGVPFDFEEHVRLMYELMTLAYQATGHARHHLHGVARGQQPHLSRRSASATATTPSRTTRTAPRRWRRTSASRRSTSTCSASS